RDHACKCQTYVISEKVGRQASAQSRSGPRARQGRRVGLCPHPHDQDLKHRRLRLLPGPPRPGQRMSLVEIKGLKVSFRQHGGEVEAVRGVDLSLKDGESLGIVGESGSGKSVTCLALMRLLAPTATITA